MGLTRPRAHQLQDIDYKQTARVITTANVTLSGGAPATVDGTSLALTNRVLVTAQTTGTENGIYEVTVVGSGSNGTWVRTEDANATGDIKGGTIIMITEGTVYADTQWKLTTDNPITIGSTTLTFARNGNAAFGVVAVSGQSDLVSDQIGDTLTLVAGSNVTLTTVAGTDTLTIAAGGVPGGATTQVQFNDGGAFGGDAGLTYNKTTDELTTGGNITSKTAAGSILNIQRSGTTVSTNDILGQIVFQAPDVTYADPNMGAEPAFEIVAKATNAFGQLNNSTKLTFNAVEGYSSSLIEAFSVNPDGSVSVDADATSTKKIRFHEYGSSFDESFISLGLASGKIRNSLSPLTDLTATIGYEATQHIFRAETGGGATPTYADIAKLTQGKAKLETGVVLEFEGATANSNETILTVVDPTAIRTITLPDATGTLALTDNDGNAATPLKVAGLETIWVPASSMRPTLTNGLTLEHTQGYASGDTYAELEGFKINSTVITGSNGFTEFQVAMPKSWNGSSFTSRHFFFGTTSSAPLIQDFYIRASAWRSSAIGSFLANATFGTAANVSSTNANQGALTAKDSGTFTANGTVTGDGSDIINFQVYVSTTSMSATNTYFYLGTQLFFTTNAKNDA